MDEFARLACGGDEVVPAARDVRFGVQAQDVGGDGVAVMMIVKQPAVYGGLAESGLDRFSIHGRMIRRQNALLLRYSYGDLAACVALLQIPDRTRCIAERVAAIEDRRDFSGSHEES